MWPSSFIGVAIATITHSFYSSSIALSFYHYAGLALSAGAAMTTTAKTSVDSNTNSLVTWAVTFPVMLITIVVVTVVFVAIIFYVKRR